MDVAIIERLAPHLAWPLATLLMFLFAAPFIYAKLSDISRAILTLKEMPATLNGTLKEFQLLAGAVSKETKTLSEQVEALQSRMNKTLTELTKTNEQIKETQTELHSAQIAYDESSIDAESKEIEQIVGTDPEAPVEGFNLDRMHESVVGRWTVFEKELKERVEAAGRDYNPKRPGQAAFVLTDRRRRPHITREEADLITRLGRQYRKFERLSDAKEQWLTPEVFSAFMRGLDQALRAIRGTNNSRGRGMEAEGEGLQT